MYIIVHGALYQNCTDFKSLQYKVCTKVGIWCMVYVALHQKCADLQSMIESVYPSWYVVNSGALHHNCGDLKSTIQGVYQS